MTELTPLDRPPLRLDAVEADDERKHQPNGQYERYQVPNGEERAENDD